MRVVAFVGCEGLLWILLEGPASKVEFQFEAKFCQKPEKLSSWVLFFFFRWMKKGSKGCTLILRATSVATQVEKEKWCNFDAGCRNCTTSPFLLAVVYLKSFGKPSCITTTSNTWHTCILPTCISTKVVVVWPWYRFLIADRVSMPCLSLFPFSPPLSPGIRPFGARHSDVNAAESVFLDLWQWCKWLWTRIRLEGNRAACQWKLTKASLYALRRPMTRSHRHESDDFNLELLALSWELLDLWSCGVFSVVRGSCEFYWKAPLPKWSSSSRPSSARSLRSYLKLLFFVRFCSSDEWWGIIGIMKKGSKGYTLILRATSVQLHHYDQQYLAYLRPATLHLDESGCGLALI